jgi:hypothetical protein
MKSRTSSSGKCEKMKQVPCQRAAGRDKGLAAVHDGQVIDEDDVTLRKKKKSVETNSFLRAQLTLCHLKETLASSSARDAKATASASKS